MKLEGFFKRYKDMLTEGLTVAGIVFASVLIITFIFTGKFNISYALILGIALGIIWFVFQRLLSYLFEKEKAEEKLKKGK